MMYTHNYMKIFLDTADIDEIRAANETGLIDGVTTNPTLILRLGELWRMLPNNSLKSFHILKVCLLRL